jgi:hypothetical protein
MDMKEHWDGVEDSLKLMQWCLNMLEHWDGSEHPVKWMQWCLDIHDKYQNDVEYAIC